MTTNNINLIKNVASKLYPIFKRFSTEEQWAIYQYFFPIEPKKLPPSKKSRLIDLYNPMADRNKFKDGLRYCCNVYKNCSHACTYCYANGYLKDVVGKTPHAVKNFEKKFLKDLNEIKNLGVPAAPIHLSNSTDPLQEHLERTHRHTLFALKQILANRNLFSSIVILTKNPGILTEDEYLSVISSISDCTVQVSCAYYNDDVRKFYEPKAPEIKSRLKALEKLSAQGITTELRIDPLFPSTRIKCGLHKPLPNYNIPEAQTADDIHTLVWFAKNAGARSIVAKPLKIPYRKKELQIKDWFRPIYADCTLDKKPCAQGGTWRLPKYYQDELIADLAQICENIGIEFKHCLHDVLNRK